MLRKDNWDDYGYRTSFQLELLFSDGTKEEIGGVSIAYEGMEKKSRTSSRMDTEFEELPDNFFSLGFHDKYYWKIKKLIPDLREELLVSLQDLAFDIERFNDLLRSLDNESVLHQSLLRNTKAELVRSQFHRIATGGTRYLGFEISIPVEFENLDALTFKVEPESKPPSNVHALIGSNGVGKTFLLHHIVERIAEGETDDETQILVDSEDDSLELINVVQVAFSPFDQQVIVDLEDYDIASDASDISFVGLAKDSHDEPDNKSTEELVEDFTSYVEECVRTDKVSWLWKALSNLESDPLLSSNPAYLLAAQANEEDRKDLPRKLAEEFSKLSSGHKIVLLVIAALSAKVDEGTLVLIDEPENHLHPPLLSSFIRALSELLYDRNGLAIVGTHSPVVLQEIPQTCVWKIFRSGEMSKAERPRIETFGENVGILTREVFGLQVRESGFYRMLADVVKECDTYEEVMEEFDGELGGEAKALVQALLAGEKG